MPEPTLDEVNDVKGDNEAVDWPRAALEESEVEAATDKRGEGVAKLVANVVLDVNPYNSAVDVL